MYPFEGSDSRSQGRTRALLLADNLEIKARVESETVPSPEKSIGKGRGVGCRVVYREKDGETR